MARSCTPHPTSGAQASSLQLLCSLAVAIGCAGGGSPNESDEEAPPGGGQTGEETIGCIPIQSSALARAEASPLGFSADEVLESLGSERALTLRWPDGTTTPLQLSLSYAGGNIEFQDREYRSINSAGEIEPVSIEIAIDCDDVVQIALTLHISTDDGAFDEIWPVALDASAANTARVYYPIDLAALSGSYQVTAVNPADFTKVSAELSLNLVGMIWTGTLDGQAESTAAPSNEESSVTERSFSIATF